MAEQRKGSKKMRLTQDHPDFDNTIVILDGRPCKCVLAADDEEGWVDVPDLAAMTPQPVQLDEDKIGFEEETEPGKEREVSEWEKIPVLRRKGKVQFRILRKTGA